MMATRNAPAGPRGFTLIELLVVVSIVGVLAAVTVPAVSSARDRGESAAIEAEVGAYGDAAATVLAASGLYPVPDPSEADDEHCGETGLNGAPEFCCVSAGECTYAGRTLQPLSAGAFSSGNIFGGALPRLPRLPSRPIAAGGSPLQYKGVFHSCDTVACQNPTVTWTQPSACPAGTTRNNVTGFCQRKIDRAAVTVTGQSETYCYDGEDNEGDGATDCADSDCTGRALCGAETSAERCADEFDNDGDGAADCDDSGCAGVGSCDSVATETDCVNGDDDDLDTFTDCADADCDGLAGTFVGHLCEYGAELSCSESFDNDADGHADCADADCSGQPGCVIVSEICGNSIDDEGDHYIDCNDSECDGQLGPQGQTCQWSESLCADGFDNDGDGLADCDDQTCAIYYACGGNEANGCTNEIDDDGDGFTNCDDGDCAGHPSCP